MTKQKTFIITGTIDGGLLNSIYTCRGEKLTREMQLDAIKFFGNENPNLLGIKFDVRITNQSEMVVDAIGKFVPYKNDEFIFVGDVVVENIYGFRHIRQGAHDRNQYHWGKFWNP